MEDNQKIIVGDKEYIFLSSENVKAKHAGSEVNAVSVYFKVESENEAKELVNLYSIINHYSLKLPNQESFNATSLQASHVIENYKDFTVHVVFGK